MNYMNWIRGLILRRRVVMIFLLTGLIAQVQAVYACGLMDNPPSSACCCGAEMTDGCTLGGGCSESAMPVSPDCCNITLDTPPSLTAAPVTPSHVVALLDTPQPPAALPPLSYSYGLDPPAASHAAVFGIGPPIWLAGTDTYLITLRLRI